MDKEQTNELKPGDEILIRGRFEKIKENGDYSISYLLTTVRDKLYMYRAAVHPSAVIIKSPPKHDPVRFFKKGDKVRVVEWKGRKDFRNGMFAIVKSGEHSCLVEVEFIINGSNVSFIYPACCLELVTPVEELEPFEVECDDDDEEYSVTCGCKFVCTYPYDSDSFYTKEQAKAAAEAECARLNAEYRKEHANE